MIKTPNILTIKSGAAIGDTFSFTESSSDVFPKAIGRKKLTSNPDSVLNMIIVKETSIQLIYR